MKIKILEGIRNLALLILILSIIGLFLLLISLVILAVLDSSLIIAENAQLLMGALSGGILVSGYLIISSNRAISKKARK